MSLVRNARPLGRRLHHAAVISGVLSLLLSIAGMSAAQTSATATRILGKVVNSETGAPLPYANLALARVAAPGDTVPVGGVLSQNDGSYRLEVEPGTYRIAVSYIGYHPRTVTDIVVTAGTPFALDITLLPQALQIETIKVTAKAQKTETAFQLTRQKKAAAVSDGISSEQISKTTDSNAADALQRVTGLSVVGGQYVYVRGLGERYSTTTINGSQIGSPETNKRVMPMDLIASSLLDNMVVQKTYTPDQPGDFGGGIVDIATREFPGQRVWNVSVGSGYNSSTTARGFGSYRGSDLDFLGFDDGVRKLPGIIPMRLVRAGSSLCETCLKGEEVAEMGRAFNMNWNTRHRDAGVPRSLSMSYGNESEVLGRSLGYIGSLSYSRGFQGQERVERSYDGGGEELNLATDYEASESKSSVLWGAMGSMSYRLSDFHQINTNVMYNRSSEDRVRAYEGQNNDYGARLRQTRFDYVERGIFTSGLGMKHNIPALFGSAVDWKLGYSNTERNEPDKKSYIYEHQEADTASGTPESWALSTRGLGNGFSRSFGQLAEDTRTFDGNWSVGFKQWSSLESKLKAGVHLYTRDRRSEYRRFAYITPQTGVDRTLSPEELLNDGSVGTTNSTFRLEEFTRTKDSYRAAHDISAQYVMVDLPLSSRLRLVTGGRRERSDQGVTTFDLFHNPLNEDERAHLLNVDYLPAANLTYSLSADANLRAAFSRTVNRPDIRELSTFLYLDDAASGYYIGGNPDLVRARIANYDLRTEIYPSLDELVAISGFYKELDDAIVQVLSAQPEKAIIPQNATKAKLYGVELEARMGLRRLASALTPFRGSVNLTFIESEAETKSPLDNSLRTRPLNGQSPYVVNAGLFFDAIGGTTASMQYTVFGKRLYALGLGTSPDIYERPRHSLDLSASRAFGGLNVKLGVENVLNDEEEFRQGGSITKQVKTGRTLSLSLSTGS